MAVQRSGLTGDLLEQEVVVAGRKIEDEAEAIAALDSIAAQGLESEALVAFRRKRWRRALRSVASM